MRPIRIKARNFGPFGSFDLEFVDGITVILGEIRDASDGVDSNGAGKSHVLEAIDVALFGARDGEKTLGPLLTRGEEELEVELTFTHGSHGRVYRVRRGYVGRGRSTSTLDFEVALIGDAPDFDWRPQTRSSVKETQALVEQTIGMGRDLARNSWYLAQGSRCFADPSWDNAARKELLAEAVFGLESPWPGFASRAGDERRVIEAELRRLDAETAAAQVDVKDREFVEEHLGSAQKEEDAATVAVLEADEQQKASQVTLDQAREVAQTRATAAVALSAAQTELAALTATDTQLRGATETLRLAREELAALPDPGSLAQLEEEEQQEQARTRTHAEAVAARTAALQMHGQRTKERDDLNRQAVVADENAARVRAKLTEFRHVDATCDRCHQPLADEASRTAAVTSVTAEAEMREREARELRFRAAAVEIPAIPLAPEPLDDTNAKRIAGQLAQLRAGEAQRARIEERIRTAEETQAANADPDLDAKRVSARTAVVEAERHVNDVAPVDLVALERQVSQARFRGEQERDRLSNARVAKARYEEKLAVIREAEQKINLARVRAKELNEALDEVVALERACGRDGIPALILEARAVPFIEAEANGILALLGMGFQVELRTLAETKSGTLRDCLDIVLHDPDGYEASFRTFSGGEEQRITFALQLALSRLLAAQHGAQSELLAIDELPYLDESGMVALGNFLGTLAEFPIILLVSHLPALRDAFERSLVVVRENRRSRILGADGLAVAA